MIKRDPNPTYNMDSILLKQSHIKNSGKIAIDHLFPFISDTSRLFWG